MEVLLELENGFSPFPDFLKIYNSQTVSQRVTIPRRYIKYYPKPLPQTAVLKKPEGNFWTVKWKLSQDGTISFEDGWTKFVADNEIIERDFLLFTYDGSRSFWVRIYRNGLPVNPTAPVTIQEISDGEDETTGDDDDGDETIGNDDGDSNENMIVSLSLGSDDDETTGNGDGDELTGNDDEDSHENMIVSLSLGSDEDYDVDDDEDYGDTMVHEATAGSSKRDWSGRRNGALVSDPETYLDKGSNAFFISTISTSARTKGVLIIGQQAIRDHQLSFGGTIKLVDGFGEVTKNVGKWKDRVVVKKWDQIIKRNNAKPGDTVICEICREENEATVQSIKAHFVKK